MLSNYLLPADSTTSQTAHTSPASSESTIFETPQRSQTQLRISIKANELLWYTQDLFKKVLESGCVTDEGQQLLAKFCEAISRERRRMTFENLSPEEAYSNLNQTFLHLYSQVPQKSLED